VVYDALRPTARGRVAGPLSGRPYRRRTARL